jgi:hypothetical protein
MTPPRLPPLQPRSPTEVVDAAVQLVRGHFAHFLTLAAIGAIPLLVISIVQAIVLPSTAAIASGGVGAINPAYIWLMVPFQLVAVVLATVQSAAVLVSGFAALRAEPLPTLSSAFQQAFGRTLHIIGVYVIGGLAAMLALLPIILVPAVLTGVLGSALGIGRGMGVSMTIVVALFGLLFLLAFLCVGIFVGAVITLANTLVVVERLGPVAALRRAWTLMAGSRWRQVGVWGITYLVLFIALIALVSIGASSGNEQVMAALNVVAFIPISPFFGGVMLTSYADLRARREGADLDAELSALGQPA